MNENKLILWLGIEDYSGLWEAVWQLRSLDPKADTEALIARARISLTELISRDFIKLYRCQEPYGDVAQVEATEAETILLSDESYRAPSAGAISIRFTATPAGQEAYAGYTETDSPSG